MPKLPQWFVRNQRGIAERNRVPLSPVSDICVNLRNLWTIAEGGKGPYPDME